jgi:hypothetical protein
MDIQHLLDLRKVTQAISRKFETDLKAHLTTLAPLFSPLSLFGEYVRGGNKKSGPRSEKAYRELCARFKSVAEQKPFFLGTPLTAPLDLFVATPVLTPLEYTYTAHSGEEAYQITVTSPLKWTLSYPEAKPKRLRALTTEDRNQVEEELNHTLLQSVAMVILFEQQKGLARLFQDLRFPLIIRQLDGLGALPTLLLTAPLDSRLPEDEIIIKNTQLTGIASFEEVIDIEDVQRLSDPIRQELIAITQSLSPAIHRELAD